MKLSSNRPEESVETVGQAPSAKMRPFAECPISILKKISVVMTDIDDTITSHGQFPSTSLRALEKLSEAGILVIPVTGRPAGWCDYIARMWPVAAVVGENGAFHFSYDREKKKMKNWFVKSEAEQKEDRRKLDALAKEVLSQVPGSALASDQNYRIADLAIDFCEDVPRLPDKDIQKIVDILEAGGATTKVSSIHVNTWFGSYDKLTTSGRCLKDLFGLDMTEINDQVIFTGDSPNDSPMFAFFNQSVGVANVRDFKLPAEPTWVTDLPDAKGFAQVAEAIINARKAG